MPLWKSGRFIEDDWQTVEDDAPVPEVGKVVVSLKRWREERMVLARRAAPLGLQIAPGSVWTDVIADLPRFPVIVLTVPKYADGRAFSIARLLRERDHYQGEIRVTGVYIVDQIPLMTRVGIDAFQTDDPLVIKGLERGLWPEVTDYLQPVNATAEVPAGSRPWTRKRAPQKDRSS
jgi:phosphoadenosine phosphosulfate reductase